MEGVPPSPYICCHSAITDPSNGLRKRLNRYLEESNASEDKQNGEQAKADSSQVAVQIIKTSRIKKKKKQSWGRWMHFFAIRKEYELQSKPSSPQPC